jgi:transposase-like protein
MKCPYCTNQEQQIKDGKNRSGTQRYLCKVCQRHYTPEPKEQGYPEAIRMQAVRMYVDGMNLRRIGRQLGVNHQSVANWVKAYVAQLPAVPGPGEVEVVEMDELHTFVKRKKTKPTS